MMLKYIKNRLLEFDLSDTMDGPITASDIDWVITVPAIWKSRGKQMMREAAYKVTKLYL